MINVYFIFVIIFQNIIYIYINAFVKILQTIWYLPIYCFLITFFFQISFHHSFEPSNPISYIYLSFGFYLPCCLLYSIFDVLFSVLHPVSSVLIFFIFCISWFIWRFKRQILAMHWLLKVAGMRANRLSEAGNGNRSQPNLPSLVRMILPEGCMRIVMQVVQLHTLLPRDSNPFDPVVPPIRKAELLICER